MVIGQRHMNMRFIARRNHGVEPRFCPARKRQRRCTRGRIDDANILHKHTMFETRTYGLLKGLFGGKALRIGSGFGKRALGSLGAFHVGENTIFKSCAKTLNRFGDALDVT